MAKVAFSKLGLKPNTETKTININNQEIEVKQYLPANSKLELIGNVINKADADDDNNFANPVKIEIFGALEILYFYTNLTFTEKQKEDPGKLYDLLDQNGIFAEVAAAIPKAEYDFVISGIEQLADAIYKYRNSALGILENAKQDYENLDFDIESLKNNLSDKGNLSFLRDVLTKLG